MFRISKLFKVTCFKVDFKEQSFLLSGKVKIFADSSQPLLQWSILKYNSNILEVYLQSIYKVILQVSIFQPIELKTKKKYTSSLYYFDKKSTFEAQFCEIKSTF